jgi:hypothetical protein
MSRRPGVPEDTEMALRDLLAVSFLRSRSSFLRQLL